MGSLINNIIPGRWKGDQIDCNLVNGISCLFNLFALGSQFNSVLGGLWFMMGWRYLSMSWKWSISWSEFFWNSVDKVLLLKTAESAKKSRKIKKIWPPSSFEWILQWGNYVSDPLDPSPHLQTLPKFIKTH